MSEVKNLYDTTVDLIELLEKESMLDRDEKIIRIEQLLQKREGFINSIKPPFSEDEKQVGKRLIELNQKLTALLQKEKDDIQKDMNHLKKQKQSSEKYTNPYDSLMTDGVFYDKRK